MKLQKVLIILGVSTCLIAAETQGTFGMGDDTVQEGSGQDEEEQEEVSEEPNEPGEPVVPGEASKQAPLQPEQPDVPEPQPADNQEADGNLSDSVVTDKDSETEGGSGDTASLDEATGGDNTNAPSDKDSVLGNDPVNTVPSDTDVSSGDDPANTVPIDREPPLEEDLTNTNPSDEAPANEEGSSDAVAPDKTPAVDTGNAADDSEESGEIDMKDDGGESEDSGTGDMISDFQGEDESLDTNQNQDENMEEIPEELWNDSIEESESQDAEYGNLFGEFTPSSEFIDNRSKIKFNVEMPIEGLPKFITTEMVVGALKCQDETGYPASVTIAQIIQESGFGKYGPEGDKGQGLSYLAFQYNNLFGIKGTGPAGSVDMRTGEQSSDGTRYHITAGFRVYHTYTECIEDRAELLKEVYSDLTYGVKDANTFAMKIGKRWATSLTYGQNLIYQMRRYELYRLDEMTLEEFSDLLGDFVNPCPGSVLTSDFGYRTAPIAGASTYHKGIDLGTGIHNIPTYAAQKGIVTFAGPGGPAGNLIVIAHENGLVTKYMHHDKIYVETGDEVEKGQQIGLSGTTGNSTGNHLHFQVEKDGVAVNPLLYLNIQ